MRFALGSSSRRVYEEECLCKCVNMSVRQKRCQKCEVMAPDKLPSRSCAVFLNKKVWIRACESLVV